MTTWRDALTGLYAAVQGAVDGFTMPLTVGIGYPPVTAPQNIARGGALVMIYDRGVSHDVTRWIPKYIAPPALTLPGVTLEPLATPWIKPTSTLTLTFSGSPIAQDAFGIVFDGAAIFEGVTYTSAAAQPLSGFITQVAAAVNADAVLTGLITATASGNSVVLTSAASGLVNVIATTGNVGSSLREVHRTKREAQVIVMAQTPDIRDTVADAIDVTLAQLEIEFGLQLPDTSWVRVISAGDISLEENIRHNVYRRDFIVTLEYGVTYQDIGYTVLAPLGYKAISYQE